MSTSFIKSNYSCITLFRENILMFYEYLLNIDTSVYETENRDRGIVESMVIRLEDLKKLLSLLSS